MKTTYEYKDHEEYYNGIRYRYSLAPMGAYFVLFPKKHHTKEDIELTKRMLRYDQDVLGISINKGID